MAVGDLDKYNIIDDWFVCSQLVPSYNKDEMPNHSSNLLRLTFAFQGRTHFESFVLLLNIVRRARFLYASSSNVNSQGSTTRNKIGVESGSQGPWNLLVGI